MEKFTDRLNREWSVELDNSMLPDLKAAGFDLSKFPRDESGAAAFAADLTGVLLDPERLGRILWTVCEEQCAARGIDERAFARGFNADALVQAADAVLLATFDHVFLRPELRGWFRERLPKAWEKIAERVQSS